MRRFHEDEREARGRDEAGAVTAPVSHAARMIALQRTAGNHAVAAMLAREAKPKAEPAPGLAVLGGLGTIPLESVSLSEPQRGGTREQPTTSREVMMMSKQGEHSQALQRASAEGTVFEAEILIGDKLKVKHHKAMVSSFVMSGSGDSMGEPMDSWSLNAESIEFITDER
jgi:hypothetical protein